MSELFPSFGVVSITSTYSSFFISQYKQRLQERQPYVYLFLTLQRYELYRKQQRK
nr:MAG TPA: hypothetical protein [Caudoviricetes sp.]